MTYKTATTRFAHTLYATLIAGPYGAHWTVLSISILRAKGYSLRRSPGRQPSPRWLRERRRHCPATSALSTISSLFNRAERAQAALHLGRDDGVGLARLQARLHQKDGGATLVVGLEEDD